MRQEHRPKSAHANVVYHGRDLDAFKAVLEDLLAELRGVEDPLVASDQLQLTKIRIASAIFMFADRGERNPERLKRLVRGLLDDVVELPPSCALDASKARTLH